MLSQTSQKLKGIILAEFTKQLILNYGSIQGVRSKEIEKKQIKKDIAKIIKKEHAKKQRPLIKRLPRQNVLTIKPPKLKPLPKPRRLTIPETHLPPHLQYLKPKLTQRELDLGKLNPLINDPVIKTIECPGPDKPIIVHTPIQKPTKIILSKEEIDEVINKFSEATKIPVEEGVIKIVAGKLILSAIVSEVVGSKFIIKKIMYRPIFK